jgi:hypothetical protein
MWWKSRVRSEHYASIMLIAVAIIWIFPQIVTYLPQRMLGKS